MGQTLGCDRREDGKGEDGKGGRQTQREKKRGCCQPKDTQDKEKVGFSDERETSKRKTDRSISAQNTDCCDTDHNDDCCSDSSHISDDSVDLLRRELIRKRPEIKAPALSENYYTYRRNAHRALHEIRRCKKNIHFAEKAGDRAAIKMQQKRIEEMKESTRC